MLVHMDSNIQNMANYVCYCTFVRIYYLVWKFSHVKLNRNIILILITIQVAWLHMVIIIATGQNNVIDTKSKQRTLSDISHFATVMLANTRNINPVFGLLSGKRKKYSVTEKRFMWKKPLKDKQTWRIKNWPSTSRLLQEEFSTINRIKQVSCMEAPFNLEFDWIFIICC